MTDHLAAEALLKTKLAEVTEFQRVYTVRDLANVSEAAQIVPSAHIVYQGERFDDVAGKGDARVITQTWLVVVCVDSATDPVASPAAAAGVLMQKVIDLLAGYKLGAGFRECLRVDAPAPVYSGSFAYYPLAFEVAFIGG